MKKYFEKKFWKYIYRRSLNNWYKRNFSSPSPEFVKHEIIKKNNLDNSLWIETGTYYGDTTNLLSNLSSKVISIEADKRLNKLNLVLATIKSDTTMDNSQEEN